MKSLIRNLAIFVIIFTILAFTTTFFLIKSNKAKYSDDNPIESGINEYNIGKWHIKSDVNNVDVHEKIRGIDLDGTYDQNDLIICGISEMYNGVSIDIPQIDGLKNIKIQNKVNESIKNDVYDFLESIPDVEETYYSTLANFANIISINFSVSSDGGNSYDWMYLNYELLNGERLKFENVFTDDADILKIVKNGFYNYGAKVDFDENCCGEDNQYDPNYLASPDENQVYRVVKDFMRDENKHFYLTPSYVWFFYDDFFGNVDFIDIANDVGIYNRYLTNESLYVSDDVGLKNIFTCSNASYDVFDNIKYGYLEDNFWYDVTISKIWNINDLDTESYASFEIFRNNKYDEMYEIVERYREMAKNNPDKFYILLNKWGMSIYSDDVYLGSEGWKQTYSDMAVVSIETNIYEMPISVYEETYKANIVDAYRNKYFELHGGAIIYSDPGDGAEQTSTYESKLYNYKTGDELTKLEDVFIENSGYMDIIINSIKNDLNVSGEELSSMIANANYKVTGDGVTFEGIDNYSKKIYFYDFDKSMFKLMHKAEEEEIL